MQWLANLLQSGCLEDEPRKPLYSRKNLTPDTPLVREPEKAPAPELTPEQIDRRLAILDKVGTRLLRLDNGIAVVFQDEPKEKEMHALADLRMGLPVVLERHTSTMDLFYPLLGKGWLDEWDRHGWRGVEEIIRHAVTQIA